MMCQVASRLLSVGSSLPVRVCVCVCLCVWGVFFRSFVGVCVFVGVSVCLCVCVCLGKYACLRVGVCIPLL